MIDSPLIQSINDFISNREMSGYKTNIYERYMQQFIDYCYHRDISFDTLSESVLVDYCYFRDETEQTKRARMNMMIQYATYLKRIKFNISIPRHRNHGGMPTHTDPYIYSEDEIRRFFYAIDYWEQSKYSNSNRNKVDPLLFRMYYGCGLRLTEALRLQRKDVNEEDGYLYIRNGKNNRSRIVPMTDSLTKKCKTYIDSYLGQTFDPEFYFFYARDPQKPTHDRAIYERFRQYLGKAGINHTGHGPRIHDFRHTYCIHRMKQWVLEGKDLNEVLPYLSKYLGHVDFRGTEYYLRLTADLYPELISRMEQFESNLLPKKEADVQ